MIGKIKQNDMGLCIEELNELKKHITTEDGKKALKEIKKCLAHDEKLLTKLYTYFSLTLDGVQPEDAKQELKL